MPVEDINAPRLNTQPAPKKNIKVGEDDDENNPYLAEVKKVAKARLVGEAIGVAPKGDGHEQSLTATVVKAALDNSTDLVKRANEAADKKEALAETLREQANNAQVKLFELMFGEINRLGTELKTTTEKMAQGIPVPKNSQDTIKETLEIIKLIGEGIGPKTQAQAPGASFGEQIELTKLQHDHAERMKQLEIQLQQMNTDLQLKLAEYNDTKEQKRLEREDSQKFRQDALAQITDAAASIAAGFSKRDGAPAISTPHIDTKNVQAPAQPMIKTFPCESCQTDIAIDEAAKIMACPSCGAEYELQ